MPSSTACTPWTTPSSAADQPVYGDYWVVGPVTIVGIDPPSTQMGGRTMNGAMVNPSPTLGSTQGYDSAMYAGYGPAYDADLNVALDISSDHPVQRNRSGLYAACIFIAGGKYAGTG